MVVNERHVGARRPSTASLLVREMILGAIDNRLPVRFTHILQRLGKECCVADEYRPWLLIFLLITTLFVTLDLL